MPTPPTPDEAVLTFPRYVVSLAGVAFMGLISLLGYFGKEKLSALHKEIKEGDAALAKVIEDHERREEKETADQWAIIRAMSDRFSSIDAKLGTMDERGKNNHETLAKLESWIGELIMNRMNGGRECK